MQPAVIIQNAHGNNQRCTGEDAPHLGPRGALEDGQNGDHHAAVDSQSSEQGHGRSVDFARTRQVHHAKAQGQCAHRHGQRQRRQQSHAKGNQTGQRQFSLTEILCVIPAAPSLIIFNNFLFCSPVPAADLWAPAPATPSRLKA